MALLDYETLNNHLADLGLLCEASEYHGILCGTLCGGDHVEVGLGLPVEDETDPATRERAAKALAAYHQEVLLSLQDTQGAYALMLPSDDESLNERVEAQSMWAAGLVLGLTQTGRIKELKSVSEELREFVQDVVDISQGGFDVSDGDEEDEQAYVEVCEYLRTGMQSAFLELRN